MGIFDIFSDQPAKDAAAAQTAGLNSGYNLASGNINQGISSLSGNYGQALDSLRQNFGAGNNSLTQNYGAGINSLQQNYSQALQPFLSNFNTANAGVNQLGNVLGLNGPTAGNTAQTFLENTPGYKFQQEQGNNAINAAAAANGTLNSGNQLLELSKFNQGLAGTTYNNYVNQLQPFLGASQNAASGIANVNTGLGNATAGQYGNLGNSLATNSANLGNATAGAYAGLGNATAGQYNQLAQMGWNKETGIGNANANADLAKYTASGNIWNAIGSLGGMGTSGGGTLGGNAVSGAGSALSSGASALMSMFSDERLKDDIEPVGELYDGTNIYRYRYKGDPMMRIGVMAQEVEQTNPDAVTEIGGYKAVDYGRATQYASELSRFLEAA